MRKVIAILLIILGLALLLRLLFMESKYDKTTSFSPYTLLSSSWDDYKEDFINEDGRVVDHSQNDITTSEGQSYALLRAVYIDDKETFDRVWNWTKENLKKENNLFGWRWGLRQDDKYGFIENGGENSATDADSDIALSLIFASERWNDDEYLREALKVLYSIWLFETAEVKGVRYMTAGNWANRGGDLVINPSYFSPFAWRIFAKVDKEHNWESLIDPAYTLLEESGRNRLDKEKGVGLPPNWINVRKTGELGVTDIEGFTTDYSFDAMRVPFRVALDYMWFGDERAKNYLTESYRILSEEYSQKGKLSIAYSHDGRETSGIENPAMYATSLGYFLIADKPLADKIYQEKIINLYSNDNRTFKKDIPYYEQNWLWFGVSLYNDFLIDLTE